VWTWRRTKANSGKTAREARTGPLRWKNYSAQTGYVYQYVLRGSRPWAQGTSGDEEYVFHATRDRKDVFAASVVLTREVMEEWSRASGRELLAAERYAVAKLSLQAAFDEYESEARFREAIVPGMGMIEQLLERLGL